MSSPSQQTHRAPQPLPSKPIVLDSAYDLLDAHGNGRVGAGVGANSGAGAALGSGVGMGSSSSSSSSTTPNNSANAGGYGSRSPGARAASLPNTSLPLGASRGPRASVSHTGSNAHASGNNGTGHSSVTSMTQHHQQSGGLSGQATPSSSHPSSSAASSSSSSYAVHQAQSHQPHHHFTGSFSNNTANHSSSHKVPASQLIPYDRHCMELTSCIITFLGPILPTEEEYRVKEATRRQLERLAGRVSPGAKLLAFGSMANGFALRNSDMDLCCLIDDTEEQGEKRSASELVEVLGQLIREETDFTVMPLPKARIPIIKINRAPTADLPYEIACDIGFENRLALENTRLLLSYAMVDPPRLRTMVLFLKVWTKRRKLNSPYTGTLSSYGYTLMALYFLAHVKKPPVLPNLQQIPPNRPLSPNEVNMNGNNIYFYDDIATLRNEWQSQNMENVGELLIEFFRYFAKEFSYSRDVISLRTETGTFPKDGVTWTGELCVEDPFQAGYNVSRPVTKDGLYTIRGEFIRASKILSNRQQRASTLIAELCKEREESLARAPETPRHAYRYGQQSPFDSPYRRHYGNASGIGGSFAFEAMARGLGKGQQNPMALMPTTAMLAPLSHNTGLTGRMGIRNPKRRNQQNHAMSSAKSDDGGSVLDRSTLTVPTTNGGYAVNGHALDQAVDLSDELAVDPSTRASRSFSDTLARSKSLPRQQMPPTPGGIPRHSQPPSPMTRPQLATGGISPPVSDIIAAIDGMMVNPGQAPGGGTGRGTGSAAMSETGSSPQAEPSVSSSPYYQTHSPWNFLVPSVGPYVPYTGPGSAAAAAAQLSRQASQSSSHGSSSLPADVSEPTNTSSDLALSLEGQGESPAPSQSTDYAEKA